MNRFDDFNRSDASSLGTPSDGGAPWFEYVSHSRLVSNSAAFTDASVGAFALLNSDLSDCTVRATWKTGAGNCGLGLRVQDSANGLVLIPGPTNISLSRLVANAYTLIGSTNPTVIVANDVVEATLSGSTITVRVNGTIVIGPVTDSTFQAATAHGFWSYDDNTSRFDDFAITALVGGDTTAPILSSPVGTQTGQTTATIGATTDEGNGTLYGVVTTSSTQPSVAQIKAGQNNGGTAAVFAGSVAVSSTGAKTISATGLTASTGYYAHLVHTDAAGNDSNRVSSAQFTTASPALSAGTATGSTTAIAASVAASAASGGTGSIAYQWYGSTTNGFTPGGGNILSGQTSQNLSAFAVSAGTTWYFVRRATDSAGTPATADTSQFTYAAPGSAGGSSSYSRGRLVNA